MTEQDDGYWLDIQVHKRVHKKLSTWGRRLGLTPEGFAKMLILQAMHPLVADENASRARRDKVEKAQEMDAAPPPSELALKMWQSQIDQYAATPDLLPAARGVHGTIRFYNADDFRWPENTTPPLPVCKVEGDKVLAVAHNVG